MFYTSDLPEESAGGTDVLFADDVTQIIEYHHKSKQMLALRTSREIQRVNNFEKQWKINTNQNKFKLLSISASKPAEVRVGNEVIPFADSIKILGFTMKRTGFGSHIAQRLAIAKGRFTKLKRFKNLK